MSDASSYAQLDVFGYVNADCDQDCLWLLQGINRLLVRQWWPCSCTTDTCDLTRPRVFQYQNQPLKPEHRVHAVLAISFTQSQLPPAL